MMTKVKTPKEWFGENFPLHSYCEVFKFAEYYAEYYLEAMSKQVEPEEKCEFHYLDFVPDDGEHYFPISECRRAKPLVWANGASDRLRLKLGIVFRTKEDAEYHLRMVDLAHEVKQLSFKPDWGDDEQSKYFLYFCHENQRVFYGCVEERQAIKMFFQTGEISKQAIALFKNNEDFLYCLNKGLI